MTFTSMINEYNRLAYTHSYIFGYARRGVVYAVRVADARSILPSILEPGVTSSKTQSVNRLVYRPNRKQVAVILENAVEAPRIVCTVEELETAFLNGSRRENRGCLFEKMVIELYKGQKAGTENTDFTTAGDMVDSKGIHWQIKYNKATFTDEIKLESLGRRD